MISSLTTALRTKGPRRGSSAKRDVESPSAAAAGPPDGAGESRRDRKKRALREHIYRVAVDLFMEKGYEETTIDEIADAADIGRATFFNHYPSKDAILHELAGEAVAYARRIFDRELGRKSGSLERRLKASLGRFARIVERNPKYYQSVFLDVMRSESGFTAPSRRGPDDLISVLAAHLEQEQRRGDIDPALDASQLAEMLTGIYMYTILAGIQSGLSYSLTERIEHAVGIFLDGCRPTRKPRKRRGAR